MKTKWKRTGRKTIAALTLTAMMAGLFPGMEWLTLKGSAEAYQPKRTITIESVSDINPTAHLVFPSEWQNSGILTVTGKIKIESMASLGPGAGFFVNNAAAVERASYKANTDGWVNLSIAVNYNEERLIFGGWYASGRMSIADLVVKKADGTVLYSLADDSVFDTFGPGEDLKGGRGLWIFQTYNNVSKFTAATAGYQPKRTITIESVSDINPTAHLVFPSEWQNAGTMTVTGRVKVDSLTSLGSGASFFVNNIAAVERASYKVNTDGWVDLSLSVDYSEARLIFGGWYAAGRMSVTDLIVKKADGTVLYSLADDSVFDTFGPGEDMKGGRGLWIFQTYNNVSKFTTSAGIYLPKRFLKLESVSDINPTAHLVFPAEWQNAGTMTVTGRIRVDSLTSLGSGTSFFVNNAAAVERASYKANTNGWVNLSITVSYSEERLIFGGWYASGNMSIADLVVKKADGTVLYSLADDGTFDPVNPGEDMKGGRGLWVFQTYNNVSKFTAATAEKPVSYEPERELIIDNTSDVNPTAQFTFPSHWMHKGPFLLTGKVKIESISSLGADAAFYLDNGAAASFVRYNADTDGWVDLSVIADFDDVRFVFGGRNAAGRMRLADLKIQGSDGSVLYRLSADPVFDSIPAGTDIAGSRGDWLFQTHTHVSRFGVKTWYSPHRYLVIDSTSDINPTAHLIFPSSWTDQGPLRLTGRVRIEGFTSLGAGSNMFINNAAGHSFVNYFGNTDGWADLDIPVSYADGRLIFGGWYAGGQMKLTDLTLSKADGTVLYSLTDDDTFAVYGDKENIVGGRGLWIFQRYNNMSKMNVVSPPVDADYVPGRSLYISPSTDVNSTAHFVFPAEWASYGTFYLVGYLKTENFHPQGAGAAFFINSGAGQSFKSYNYNTGRYQKLLIPASYSDGRFIFGSWYAAGDFVLSDIEIRKQDGTLLYALETDPFFDNIGSHIQLLGGRGHWVFQNYNNATEFTVRSKMNPIRSLVMTSAADTHPTAQFLFPSFWETEGRLHLTGIIRISDFSALGADAKVCIQNAAGADFRTFSGGIDQWEQLSVTAAYSDRRIVFSTRNAAGKITLADLEVSNDKGEILYSFADDPVFDGLEAQTDIAGSYGRWTLQTQPDGAAFVLLDNRQWNYSMTSGRYSVSDHRIVAPISSVYADDFLADLNPGIDGTVRLFQGQTPVTDGLATTGMTVSLLSRGGQLLSEYDVAVLGDLNADGIVDTSDIADMQAHIAGTKTFTGVCLTAGDLNGDGSIGAADLPLRQQLVDAYAGQPGSTLIDSYQDIVTMSPGHNGVNAGTLEIVRQNTGTAKIIVSAYAPSKVTAAAETLRETLFKMTGTRLEIADDTAVHTGNLILVGDSRYTRRLGIPRLSGYPKSEKVLLKTLGNRLVLIGNDCGNYAGTDNAVTMFLESLGCGWFGPDALWEEIPKTSDISVGKYQIEHTPQFTNRITRVYDTNREMGSRWYQGGDRMIFGHGLPNLVSRENYFSAHPEWFCLINGQRNPYGVEWWQYCYSNASLAAKIGEEINLFFDRNPDYTQFTLAANDGYYHGWCECADCAALGSRTDQILTFANRVAAAVAEKHPEKKLTILSYFANFYAPTRQFTLEPNLEIQFARETNMYQPVSSGFNMGSSRYPETDNTYTVSWKDNAANWQARTDCQSYGIWEWYCPAVSKPEWQYIPWVQGRVAIQNQQYWKSMGADYVYYDQGPLTGYYETQDDYDLRWPLWYVASKGMWDGSLTSEQILRDACRKLYGSAADAMYGYYKCLEDISAECTARSVVWYAAPANQMYTAANISRVNAKVSLVRQALSGVTATQRARIENQIGLWETAKQHI